MPRFRLRYQSTDLEMQIGDFVVGRSSSCHLSLDDALVSRRHATFHVSPDAVVLEDLGSRNGVQLNGESISGRARLKHLDRVVIGAQELLLIRVQQAMEAPRRDDRPTLAGMTLDLPVMRPEAFPDEPTVHRMGSVVDRIADKAIAMGRFDEAERMLSRRLEHLLETTRQGAKLDEEKRLAASNYALQLAEGTKRSRWIDYVFQLHDAVNEVVEAEHIARLHDIVRQVRYPGGPAFRNYLANLQGRADQLTPAKRFVLQRLEGIERMIGA
ncbi:MAG: FHA domain-containing protein [Sandaracinaceae bacterium]